MRNSRNIGDIFASLFAYYYYCWKWGKRCYIEQHWKVYVIKTPLKSTWFGKYEHMHSEEYTDHFTRLVSSVEEITIWQLNMFWMNAISPNTIRRRHYHVTALNQFSNTVWPNIILHYTQEYTFIIVWKWHHVSWCQPKIRNFVIGVGIWCAILGSWR